MFHEVHMHLVSRADGGAAPDGTGALGNGTESFGPPLAATDPNDNNGPKTVIVMWFLWALAAIFLVLRLWCKVRRHRGLWWDDHALIGSWLCLLVDSAFITKMISLGYGKHADHTKLEDIPQMATLVGASGVFIVTAIAWSKTSFGITLLRISHGWIKVFVWFIIISMNILMGLSPLLHYVSCTPIKKAWDPFVEGTCWDPVPLVYYDVLVSAYSAAMDFVLAILPFFLIKNLQMHKREKIGIALAMSMGIFAGATAIVKCIYLPVMLDPDFSYKGVELSIWGSAEVSTTIIAATIPVLRVFIRDVKSSVERYYGRAGVNQTALDNATRKSRLQSGNHILVEVGSDVEKRLKHDDSSDRSILAHGKIVQTTEINVERHSRSYGDQEVEAVGYEMRIDQPLPYEGKG